MKVCFVFSFSWSIHSIYRFHFHWNCLLYFNPSRSLASSIRNGTYIVGTLLSRSGIDWFSMPTRKVERNVGFKSHDLSCMLPKRERLAQTNAESCMACFLTASMLPLNCTIAGKKYGIYWLADGHPCARMNLTTTTRALSCELNQRLESC